MRTAIVLTALFFTLSAAARADCLCTEASFAARWKKADAVFAGTVRDIEVQEKLNHYGTFDPPVRVTFRVDESYKADKGNKSAARQKDGVFALHTSLTQHTCTGYPFEKGEQYLVFAYKREDATYERDSLYLFPSGTYETGGLCGGTKKFTESSEDLKKIMESIGEKKTGAPRFLEKLRGK